MLAVSGARGDVYISELMADNENGIRDEDGDRQDWVELCNDGDADVSLDGWWLTDKSSNPTQWRFPAVSIPAKGTLLVWASNKNRTDPLQPLHTSFNLSKGGEYLGLYRPDAATGLPVGVDAFAPQFPALPPDVSYGRANVVRVSTPAAYGTVARYRVLTSDEGAAAYSGTDYASGQVGHGQSGGWNVSAAFDDAAWPAAQTPVGWDNGNKYTFGTTPAGNIKSALYNVNTSLLLRKTFAVADPAAVAGLTLRVRYEDGFVAFINGTEVLRANYSADSLAWNAKSDTAFDKPNPPPETEITLAAAAAGLLAAGQNVLAVQGLNVSAGSSDFFLDAEVAIVETQTDIVSGYFAEPTPGEVNGAVTSGPLLFSPTPADPDVPRPAGGGGSPPLTVTVRVIATGAPVASVRVYHRAMWGAESAAVPLQDDGLAPDAVAGDGIYSARLPTDGLASGQMFRWRFEARDSAGAVTKLPAYRDPLDSPQYFGTVALDASTAASRLPVLEWFVQNAPANGPTAESFRGGCYFLSNFYDNVGCSLHGQSTRGFAKKSYDFDFTGEKRFLWQSGQRRVKDINLLSNYADKTKTRNTFSHWVGQQAGTPAHFALPVRVQLNTAFHGVLDMMEDGDDRMLERNGLDPDGALYKIYNTDIVTGAEKKTRKGEDNADLRALTNGLATGKALAARQVYAYDNVDIAATVNYLATRFLNSDSDHGHKNYYLSRDTNVTGEWQPIVWDVDLSQGHVWSSTKSYFDDDLITNILFTAGSGSAVYNIVYNSPEMKQMFVRRMRTLMDTLLQPPGTAGGHFETRMRAIAAAVDPDPADPSPWTDGDLDAARWGFHANFIPNRPREEVERVIAGYVAPRRAFLFNQGAGRPAYNGVNLPAAAQTNAPGMVVIDSLDFLPASGAQAEEYVILRNTTAQAVDISGWTVDGEIRHTFKGGTVIPTGAGTAAANYVGLLHLAKDAAAFRARAGGPTGGQRRFVQGNYDGQLSARGGTVNLRDNAGLLIATFTYAGAPTLPQQRLRITELQYHPAGPTAAESAALVGVTAEDFEYIELLNLSAQPLTLTGAYFSAGIAFTFPETVFSAYQRIVVAKHPAAFAVRYPAVTAPVLGPYSGYLDNAGERLALKDAVGETVFDFEYKDGWYPHTDGTGRSLVVRDPTQEQDALDEAVAWGICSNARGSPGSSDSKIAQAYYGWDNFHFTAAQRDDPSVGGPFADPDGDGRVNWAEYAFGSDPWTPDVASIGFSFVTYANKQYAALTFDRAADALDVQYAVWATGDLQWELWSPAAATAYQTVSKGNGCERVTLRETAPVTARQRFFKVGATFDEQP
jgi:hypothetical protein